MAMLTPQPIYPPDQSPLSQGRERPHDRRSRASVDVVDLQISRRAYGRPPVTVEPRKVFRPNDRTVEPERSDGSARPIGRVSPANRTVSDRDRTFREQVLPLADSLYVLALRLTKNSTDADDLVQDSMFRAFRYWGTFKQGTNIKAWMFTILRNTLINKCNQRKRTRAGEQAVNNQMLSLGPSVAVARSTSSVLDPVEVIDASVAAARVHEALELLPPKFRRAVELADLEGLEYKEIAALMKSPVGTVMSRVHRGRKLLHGLLEDLRAECPASSTCRVSQEAAA